MRRVVVHNREIFIKPPNRSDKFVRIDMLVVEWVGVAKAFIPVIAEQDSSLSDLEVFMSDSNPSQPLRFVIFSVMNSYQRVVVGAHGEIFTLGWKAVQELVALNLVDQPVSAGTYRVTDNQSLEIRTKLRLSPPFTVTVWSEYLLGMLAVCSYREADQTWYFWVPES